MIMTAYMKLLFQKTPLNNTILHVAAQFNRNGCVWEIFYRYHSLLMQQNLKGDTPLHIVARLGLPDLVVVFLNSSSLQQLVRMRNKENDTALHEAVRNHRFEVVKLITEADPRFEYLPNDAGETPLYLAAREGLYDSVVQILETCPFSAHIGPHGRTALHEAVVNKNSGIIRVILEKKSGTIIKEVDDYGWTALHYAAQFGMWEITRQLLEVDPTIAYTSDKDGKTALHIATVNNLGLPVIKELRRGCPDCLELVDKKGQNFLHVAAENENRTVTLFVVESGLVENLMNEKDNDGNTPLHLVVKYGECWPIRLLSSVNGVNKGAINKDNYTPYEVGLDRLRKMEEGSEKYFLKFALEDLRVSNVRWNRIKQIMNEEIDETIMLRKKAKDKEEREEMEKVSQSHMLVATLIATVTFAAGFTLPGGYNSDGKHKGMAVLTEKSAFIAFMVFNTVAMLLSTFAVFINFWSTLVRDDNEKMVRLMKVAAWCMPFAITAMVNAFVTGTYAVLSHATGLAISLFLPGCSFFILFLFLLFKLYNVGYFLWFIYSAASLPFEF